MKKITHCPGTLARGFTSYSPTAIKRVFDGHKVTPFLDYSLETLDEKELNNAFGHLSISGVQEKLSVVIEKDRIIPTPEGKQGTHILKPASTNRRLKNPDQMPANEHLTMQIASQVFGIKTAENALAFFDNGQMCYITKRFDLRPDKTKIPQEDFASLAQKTEENQGKEFKYSGSYLDVADLIKKYIPAWQIEMERFFRLVIFNYLFGNDDAHLKNFSVHQTTDGDFILTPAYDLLNSSLHISDGNDFALEGGLFGKEHYSEVYESKGHPCQDDFRTFGNLIGLNEKQIKKTIQKFFTVDREAVYCLIDSSFLSETMKRVYKRSFDQNMARFARHL